MILTLFKIIMLKRSLRQASGFRMVTKALAPAAAWLACLRALWADPARDAELSAAALEFETSKTRPALGYGDQAG
jgi:hypothetical protein